MSSHCRRFLSSVAAIVMLLAAGVPLVTFAAPPGPDLKFPDPYAGKKKILIIGDIHTGAQIAHDGISHALGTLEHMGREGLRMA